MDFFGWLRKQVQPRAAAPNNATSTLSNPAAWLLNAFGVSSTTPTIAPEQAWRVGAVMNCVDLRARVIGSLPLPIYQRQPDGTRVKVPWFTPYRVLVQAPNAWMAPSGFWRTMVTNLDVFGNAYALIEWSVPDDPNSLASGLWPIHAQMVTPQRNKETRDIEYLITSSAGTVVVPKESMIHLRAFSFDGVMGVSKLTAAARAVGLAFSTEEYGSNWYNNGGVPSGVLEHPGVLSDEAAKRLAESWTSTYGSLSKSARTAILEEGTKYHPITVSPAEAQFLEVRKYSAGQIAALYGVPARLVGAHDGPVGWGSVEQETLEWVKYGLTPDLVAIEQELATKLLKGSTVYYPEFNLDALLRGDIKGRMEANSIAWEHGALTTDEWRARENMGPTADGQGGVRYIPLNFTPADRMDDLIDARVAAGNPSNTATPEAPGSPRR
jgi:HK97 family phage portal protein